MRFYGFKGFVGNTNTIDSSYVDLRQVKLLHWYLVLANVFINYFTQNTTLNYENNMTMY